MKRLKKGDQVLVIAGKSKGKVGTVQNILERDRVLVEGVNIAKKHVKPNPNAGVQGGIVDKEMPVHRSNVMLFNQKTEKPSKVGIKLNDGKRARYFKSTNELVD
jgi:large subunit ribosomal protein L24